MEQSYATIWSCCILGHRLMVSKLHCLILHMDDDDVNFVVHIAAIYVTRSYDEYYGLATAWWRSLSLILIINVIYFS